MAGLRRAGWWFTNLVGVYLLVVPTGVTIHHLV